MDRPMTNTIYPEKGLSMMREKLDRPFAVIEAAIMALLSDHEPLTPNLADDVQAIAHAMPAVWAQVMTAVEALSTENYEVIGLGAHDLRSALGVVNAYSDLLLSGTDGPLSESQYAHALRLNEAARWLYGQMNNIMDYARLVLGQMFFSPKPFDLGPILALPPRLPLQGGVRLQYDVAEGLPLVYGEEFRIQQCYQHLLDNAVQFTTSGAITISAELHEGRVRVKVSDTGPGAPKAEDIRPFCPQAADKSGLGLGLYIAKRLLEIQGRTLYVVSDAGRGSSLGFALPIVPPR